MIVYPMEISTLPKKMIDLSPEKIPKPKKEVVLQPPFFQLLDCIFVWRVRNASKLCHNQLVLYIHGTLAFQAFQSPVDVDGGSRKSGR